MSSDEFLKDVKYHGGDEETWFDGEFPLTYSSEKQLYFRNVSDGTKLWYYLDMPDAEVSGMLVYWDVFSIIYPIMVAFIGFVFINSTIALLTTERRQKKVLVWIVLSSFFSLAEASLTYFHFVGDFEGKADICLGSPSAATIAYFLANTCMYLFLHARAEAVTYGESDKLIRKILKALLYITYTVPPFSVVAFFLITGKIVYVPQLATEPSDGTSTLEGGFICTYQLEWYVTAVFLVMDTVLSIGYLVAFVLPVVKISRKTKNVVASSSTMNMAKLVKQNLKASIMAIFSTFTVMVLLTLGYVKISNGDNGPLLLFWTWTYPLAALDVTVNVIAIISITNVWMPKRVQRVLRLSPTTRTQQSATGEYSGNTSPSAREEVTSKWASVEFDPGEEYV